MTILATGGATALGRRVESRLTAAGHTLVDLPSGSDPGPAEVLLHLSAGDHDRLAGRRANAVRLTEDALEVADTSGVRHLVVLSSAMVYGAWPNNPVPLTEAAPLRPGEFAFAEQLAQVEQLVDSWRTAAPERSVTVLRPVLTLAADGTTSIVRALAAGMGERLDDDDPPSQFLHFDDLAAAVVLAATHGLDGVFNVAPDGWIAGETVRALAGAAPRVRLPSWLVEPVAAIRWRFQRGPIPPGLRPYATYGWLVANDKLRATGWAPTVTNEQAYVEGTEAKWWTMLTPKRKQEISLGAMGVITTSIVSAAALVVRRSRR